VESEALRDGVHTGGTSLTSVARISSPEEPGSKVSGAWLHRTSASGASNEQRLRRVSSSDRKEERALLDDLNATIQRPEVKEVLRRADDFSFDPFHLAFVTNGRALQVMAVHALREHDLIAALALDEVKVVAFVGEIERGMRASNPYHNATHVAGVIQFMHALLVRGGLAPLMGPVETLAALLACIIHDFEHLGLNNDFLVKIGHERALNFNDRAPNENHHLAAAWKLLLRPEFDFMVKMPRPIYLHLRKLVLQMVLATDMSEHNTMVARIKAELLPRVGAIRHQVRQKSTYPLTFPHQSGRRTFRQKSTYPAEINFEAVCGTTLVTLPPRSGRNETVVVHRVGGICRVWGLGFGTGIADRRFSTPFHVPQETGSGGEGSGFSIQPLNPIPKP